MVDKELYNETEDRMKKAIEAMVKDFASIRTGRASPAILDPIRVPAYGQEMPIKQLASISVPEARMILIQPWDQSVVGEIEKAILKSDLGINPNTDGKLIRLVFPPLTEERRKELVKVVKKRGEEAKISVRNIRRDAIDYLKEMEKESEITKDDLHQGQEEIQKLTDKYTDEVDVVIENKEKEIMDI
ncbi:MAG: ribosome recycling factor [Vulcanimicrobiota bacterium]